eukprot:TRINITY_DN29_c0_g1_i1.p1 TRINITY_DN29_c0_g1~~TRINITY_DN29_c0_g1_i1.p1  ORF type:complete len:237 (+),score=82.46 TRINITY_DN29_c0_g1_i1:32-712(+)
MKIPAVLFDLDGTLVDNSYHVVDCYQKSLKEWNLPQKSVEFIHNLQGISAEATCEALEIPSDIQEGFLESFWNHMQNFDDAVPSTLKGVDAFLRYLHLREVPLGIVTSNRATNAKNSLSIAGLFDLFKNVVGSDVVDETKPSPVPLLTCLEGMGIEHSNDIFYIGDSFSDIQAGLAAGFKPIWVCSEDYRQRRLNLDFERLLQDNNVSVFSSMDEVHEYINKILGN